MASSAVAVSGSQSPLSITIGGSIAQLSPLLVSHGWEAWQALDALHKMLDPRASTIASHMSPGIVRLGGITADWLQYTFDDAIEAPADTTSFDDAIEVPADTTSSGLLGGFWPLYDRNLSYAALRNLTAFCARANLSMLLDLNELFGRNCNTTKPTCASCGSWCGLPPEFPSWDTSNVRALLQRLHDDGAVGGRSALVGFEVRLAGAGGCAQWNRSVAQTLFLSSSSFPVGRAGVGRGGSGAGACVTNHPSVFIRSRCARPPFHTPHPPFFTHS